MLENLPLNDNDSQNLIFKMDIYAVDMYKKLMSSNSDGSCGCLILIAVAIGASQLYKGCTDKHSSAPTVSQPATGAIYTSDSRVPQRPSVDFAPTLSEPYGQLQTGRFVNGDAALRMTNNMGNPAYVKVVDRYGVTRATIYLRTSETYEMRVDPGNYSVRYVSGPGDQWRGTTHYFGSSSTFSAGETDYIGQNQRLSLTISRVRVRPGTQTNVQEISEDEF